MKGKTHMASLISIIVPVYQAERCLERCVESILDQTFRDFELILVDDGSTDQSPQLCEQYAAGDSRVKVIHKRNGGLSSARNAGLALASGNYVGFVDADDYIDKDMYRKLYEAIVAENAEVAVCNCYQVDQSGQRLEGDRYNYQLDGEILSGREILNKIGDRGSAVYVVMWNKLYQRKLFDRVRFDEGKIHEDIRIFGKLYYQVDRVVCVPERLYYYERGSSSITRGKMSLKHLDHAEAFYICFCFFLKHGLMELLAPTERRMFGTITDVYYELDKKEQRSKRMKLTKRRQQWAVKILWKYRCLSFRTFSRTIIFWLNPWAYRHIYQIMKK